MALLKGRVSPQWKLPSLHLLRIRGDVGRGPPTVIFKTPRLQNETSAVVLVSQVVGEPLPRCAEDSGTMVQPANLISR